MEASFGVKFTYVVYINFLNQTQAVERCKQIQLL